MVITVNFKVILYCEPFYLFIYLFICMAVISVWVIAMKLMSQCQIS